MITRMLMCIVVLGWGLACGDDARPPADDESSPTDEGDAPFELDIPLDVEPLPYDPDTPRPIDDPELYSGGPAPVFAEGDVEKTQIPIVWGWAMSATLKQQKKGLNPKAHCELFNKTCDNQNHYQSTALSISGWNDFNSHALGRCGRFDSGAEFDWMPCAVPAMEKKTGGKTFRWMFQNSNCPNDAAGREKILTGAQRAFAHLDEQTHLTFQESSVDPHIVVRCEAIGSEGTLGGGFPRGDLKLRWGAAFAGEEQCLDSLGETNGQGNISYAFTDFYYTYGKMDVVINWTNFFNWTTNGCAASAEDTRQIARSVILHELGHTFGFQHQNVTFNVDLVEIMREQLSCAEAKRPGNSWYFTMHSLMNDADIPGPNDPHLIFDEDISCLFPQ